MTVPTPRHGPAPPPMADSPLFPSVHGSPRPVATTAGWTLGRPAPRHALGGGPRILVLIVTGLYIGRPYFMTTGAPPHFLMGWIRLIHFVAAGVLVMTGLVRVYWLFAGNQFERLAALFPVKRDWVNIVTQVKYYLMIQPERRRTTSGTTRCSS